MQRKHIFAMLTTPIPGALSGSPTYGHLQFMWLGKAAYLSMHVGGRID